MTNGPKSNERPAGLLTHRGQTKKIAADDALKIGDAAGLFIPNKTDLLRYPLPSQCSSLPESDITNP